MLLRIPLIFSWNDKEVPVSALIDSGATGNFIDISYAQQLQLPLLQKLVPQLVRAVDGSELSSGPITLQTVPLDVRHLGSHYHGMLSFDLIATPHIQLILGLPWLRQCNPSINWAVPAISFPPSDTSHQGVEEDRQEAGSVQTIAFMGQIPGHYADYEDVFSPTEAEALPPHRSYDCPIDLIKGAQVPFGRIYALSEAENAVLKEYIEENLRKGFIRHSRSPAGAPLFFVGKKEGGLRPCIDYRELNALTIKNRYPLPLIPDLIDQVREAVVFTKLDLRGAYNLVRMRQGDEWKTAFRTRFGHFEYAVMPFGLCNAPAAFQHLVHDIFRDLLDHRVIVYLDDILIFSRSSQDHPKHVREVLDRLRLHRLFSKPEKCVFDTQQVGFLGYILTPGHVCMDPGKVQAVSDWPTPVTVKQVQSFLGFSNFYRRFIASFSEIVVPLTKLTKKDHPFAWTEETAQAFSRLKKAFTEAPILKQADSSLPFIVETDASSIALGAVLSQRDPGTARLHPVVFLSRRFFPAEVNYTIHDRELLAVKEAFSVWHHYLQGAVHTIQVWTDQKKL